ncbi:uncharacterized protein LOC131304527 [Rhododendron vialii]|uniref:uncharacterized protein LOC131304527 n=1 Tax=Rhododendron vialii TaxID=182163 RepID=UPI00265FE710|nr:uncharacterized protein LOC131304527 [Rhododendron vialii]
MTIVPRSEQQEDVGGGWRFFVTQISLSHSAILTQSCFFDGAVEETSCKMRCKDLQLQIEGLLPVSTCIQENGISSVSRSFCFKMPGLTKLYNRLMCLVMSLLICLLNLKSQSF